MSSRHRAQRVGVLGVSAAVCLAVGVVAAMAPRDGALAIVEREEAALRVVHDVAKRQTEFLARGTIDRNRDGKPEYGSLADLGDLDVRTDDAAPHLDLDGYRVEILLPEAAEHGGRVAFVRGGKGVDGALAATTFAVVAMPWGETDSGLRAFYLDAAGRRWEAEGVHDGLRDPFRPPPRRSFVDREEALREGGPVWRFRDGPPLPESRSK